MAGRNFRTRLALCWKFIFIDDEDIKLLLASIDKGACVQCIANQSNQIGVGLFDDICRIEQGPDN